MAGPINGVWSHVPSDILTFLLAITKTNTCGVLAMSLDKFGHVIWNHLWFHDNQSYCVLTSTYISAVVTSSKRDCLKWFYGLSPEAKTAPRASLTWCSQNNTVTVHLRENFFFWLKQLLLPSEPSAFHPYPEFEILSITCHPS